MSFALRLPRSTFVVGHTLIAPSPQHSACILFPQCLHSSSSLTIDSTAVHHQQQRRWFRFNAGGRSSLLLARHDDDKPSRHDEGKSSQRGGGGEGAAVAGPSGAHRGGDAPTAANSGDFSFTATKRRLSATRDAVGEDEDKATLAKVRGVLDKVMPDETVDESIEDFHPFMMKKLLGLSESSPDDVLDDVGRLQLKRRMSMPFEAALRHFKTEDKESQFASAANTFLHTRQLLKEVWKPYPGDYLRVLSLIPPRRSYFRILIYRAMIEDYEGRIFSKDTLEEVARVPADAFVPPGGGCPSTQRNLIKRFEKLHADLLQRIAFKEEMGGRNASNAGPSKAKGAPSPLEPLDTSSLKSVNRYLKRAVAGNQPATVIEMVHLLLPLMAACKSPEERAYVSMPMVTRHYTKALLATDRSPEAIVELIRGQPQLRLRPAGAVLLSAGHRDAGLELFAVARSRNTSVLALTPALSVRAWAVTFLARSPHLSGSVSPIIEQRAAEALPTSPDRVILLVLIYYCLIHYDSSYVISSNTYRFARGALLGRAKAIERRHWCTALPTLRHPSTIATIFARQLALVKDMPHPFGGVILRGAMRSIAQGTMGKAGFAIVDANFAIKMLRHSNSTLKQVRAYVQSLPDVNPSDVPPIYRALFPWAVLEEMRAGMSLAYRRAGVMRSFGRTVNTLVSVTPEEDAAAVIMSPIRHLYGMSHLGAVDAHIGSLAMLLDSEYRSLLVSRHVGRTRAVAQQASASKALEDDSEMDFGDSSAAAADEDIDGTGKGPSVPDAGGAFKDRHHRIAPLQEYLNMHVARCLAADDALRGFQRTESARPLQGRQTLEGYETNWEGTGAYASIPNPRIVVCTEDAELAAYMRSAGIITYPPLGGPAQLSSDEDDADEGADDADADEDGDGADDEGEE